MAVCSKAYCVFCQEETELDDFHLFNCGHRHHLVCWSYYSHRCRSEGAEVVLCPLCRAVNRRFIPLNPVFLEPIPEGAEEEEEEEDNEDIIYIEVVDDIEFIVVE